MEKDTADAIYVMEKQIAEQDQKFTDLENKLSDLSKQVMTTLKWADRVMVAFEQGMDEK